MEVLTKTQTAFRLSPELLAGMKRVARKRSLSLNAFVEKEMQLIVKRELELPKLPPDFEIDPVIASFNGMIKAPSQEELDADPRLKHIFRV